jgi:hypothetical protein
MLDANTYIFIDYELPILLVDDEWRFQTVISYFVDGLCTINFVFERSITNVLFWSIK